MEDWAVFGLVHYKMSGHLVVIYKPWALGKPITPMLTGSGNLTLCFVLRKFEEKGHKENKIE